MKCDHRRRISRPAGRPARRDDERSLVRAAAQIILRKVMSQFWQLVQHRGQQTVGVWGTFSPALTVGVETLTTHGTLIDSLPALAQAVSDQEDVVDDKLAARDAARALIRDLYVRVPRKIEGEIPATDPFHKDIREIRNTDPKGMDDEVKRGQMTVSLWKKFNARRAAETPPKPAFEVGEFAVADLTAAMEGLPGQTQTIETERSKLRDKTSDRDVAAEKGDEINKRWMKVWEGEFLPDTPERDALGQIDTGDAILPPTALEITGLGLPTSGIVAVTHATTGGVHGTIFRVEWKQEGEDWTAATAVNLVRPVTEVSFTVTTGTTLVFRNVVRNSQGTAISVEQSIIV